MDFENTWSAVFRPGRASRYFDVHSQRPFERPMTSFSLINAWWLAEISRLVYRDDVDDAGGKTRNALLNEVGLKEIAFVSEGGAECAVVGPDAPAADGLVVVAFRGTDDLQAWLDFNFDLLPIEWRQGGGRVHQGFKEAFDKVWRRIESALPGGTTVYTGHSLGAALATLAASRKAPVATYTFGSPLVGDGEFAATIAHDTFFRVVNNRDLVTTVPSLVGYRHVGQLHYIAHDGRIHVNPTAAIVQADRLKDDPSFELKRNLRDRLTGPPQELADHAPVNYVAHLERAV